MSLSGPFTLLPRGLLCRRYIRWLSGQRLRQGGDHREPGGKVFAVYVLGHLAVHDRP